MLKLKRSLTISPLVSHILLLRLGSCEEKECFLRAVLLVSEMQVMHGADRDIVWLQRDFGIYVCNLFDTGQVCRCQTFVPSGGSFVGTDCCYEDGNVVLLILHEYSRCLALT